MDSGNLKKIGFYLKSLRLFLSILCVVNDSDAFMLKQLFFALNEFKKIYNYLKIYIIYLTFDRGKKNIDNYLKLFPEFS